jgi:PiT family inorganic phosphate transporter
MWAWLSSALFLGWCVGANGAANIFATAVAARMIRFATVVRVSGIFVILGGLVNGPAAMDTLSRLGDIDSLPGAFSVATASAAAIAVMTAARLPVSAAQTAVGALIGSQFFFRGAVEPPTLRLLQTIIFTWTCAPLLAGVAAFGIYAIAARLFRRFSMPLLLMDQWLRMGLLAVGAYGAWAFGGNNIANVVSFYARLDLFSPAVLGAWVVSQTQMLALLGGLAIWLGIATFSHRIIRTVGHDLVRLDGVTALIAILSEALVVDFLAHTWSFGAFTLPAVPVSISQALVGALLGVGVARGVQTIQFKVLRNIILGWVVAPLLSALLAGLMAPLVMRLV